jgi:hypothetical protein
LGGNIKKPSAARTGFDINAPDIHITQPLEFDTGLFQFQYEFVDNILFK